jgi:MHS family alpha-ketoglutarate permease-like MFS transporter
MSERMALSTAAAASAVVSAPGRGRTLLGGAVGHFVEWYDWAIYGFLAGIFAGQMFPAASPTR